MLVNFNCPICGLPMVHYRLRGYRCHSESHNEMADQMFMDRVAKSTFTDEEMQAIDTALENAPPVEISNRFRERALEAMRLAQKNRAVKFN